MTPKRSPGRSRSRWGFILISFVLLGQSFIGRLAPTPYPLSYPSYYGNRIYIPADNPLTVEGVALGRRLFYEKRLSANNTLSCASCHQQTRAAGLETQAVTPLTDPHEMGQSLDNSADKLRASDKLRATDKSSTPVRSGASRRLRESGSYAAAFSAVFGSADITPERIVRAIAQFERTLHDGRFATLPEVLDHYSEHIAGGPTLSPALHDSTGRAVLLHLTDVEKKALLAFLNTLTDSTFITDPRYSDPKIN